jgi:hypothetical protein
MGEQAVHKACCDELLTVSVAPHQVYYGPRDSLFLPKLLETAGAGKLRIFGKGEKKISLFHVDNYYCHGILCSADALCCTKAAPRWRRSYHVVTDEGPRYFWKVLNQAIVAVGFTDLYSKFHSPPLVAIRCGLYLRFPHFVDRQAVQAQAFYGQNVDHSLIL